MDFLETLNPQQREAVEHVDGPLLILAGAGSGKTRVIIARMAHLIQAHSVPAYHILAVTFTNKAAGEMRSRVDNLLRDVGYRSAALPLVSTFHSFCVRLLRRHGAALAELRPGFTTSFTICDDSDQLSVIKQVYKRVGLDDKFMKPRAALSAISAAKNRGKTPDDMASEAMSPQQERLAVVFEKYDGELKKSNGLDFDDLLLESVRLLRHSGPVRMWAADQYRYMMVDEYQDTNRPQYDLMRLLTDEHKNICVVGDEDQSIYSWRGADINNILDFESDYPSATVVRLEQNYRSTKNILTAASAVVAQNVQRKGKNLWTDGADGSRITYYAARDGEAEALYIAQTVDRYLRDNETKQAAILYRMNSQSRQIEEALRRSGRQYKVVGGVSFYQRAEVRDILAYLRASLSPDDSLSVRRIINVPARGIGKTTVDKLESMAASRGVSLWEALGLALDEKTFGARAHAALLAFYKLMNRAKESVAEKAVDEALKWLIEETGYQRMLETDESREGETRLENLSELLNAASDARSRDEDAHAFLDNAALVADTDQIETDVPLLLMTLHSAKGLEFPMVVMAGMEEGLFPHSRALNDDTQLEEERRLCYVGMTRARERLHLCSARERRRYGGSAPEWMMPSRFLSELPADLLEEKTPGQANIFGGGETQWDTEGYDLNLEKMEVRQRVESRLSGMQTYDTADSVAAFFQQKGKGGATPAAQAKTSPAPGGRPRVPAAAPKAPKPAAPRPKRLGTSARAKISVGGIRRGSKVRHAKYGLGTVTGLEGDGENAKFTVYFDRVGRKKLVAKFAKLELA